MRPIFKNSSTVHIREGGQGCLHQSSNHKDGEDSSGNLAHRGCGYQEGTWKRHQRETYGNVLGL